MEYEFKCKRCKYGIDELIVEKGADYFNSIKICKVVEVEYMDYSNPLWDPDFDEEPYWLITTEILYMVNNSKHEYHEVGDYESFEDWEVESLDEYLAREITIDNYIDVKYNGKSFYKEDEE